MGRRPYPPLLFALAIPSIGVAAASASDPARPPDSAGIALPVEFVENRGQWPDAARFLARGAGLVAALEDRAIALHPSRGEAAAVRLTFEGALPGVRPVGVGPRGGRYNFYFGSDPASWRSDVPAFGSVSYRALYPGIDLLVRVEGGRLEYDLSLLPGADLDLVAVDCEGSSALELTGDGGLLVSTPAGPPPQGAPRAWERLQRGDGRPSAR